MLFKQITSYQIEMPAFASGQAVALVPLEWRESIENKAHDHRFRPLSPLQQVGQGFEPPLHKINSEFVVSADSCGLLLLCYRIDTKALNAAGIKESVEAKATLIEREEGRRVRKLEREALHDDFVIKAMPHIQPTPKRILILLDLNRLRVLIGTKSETLATELRRTLAEHILPAYEIPTADEPETKRPRLLVDSNCKGDPREHYFQWMIQGVIGMQLHDGAYLEKEASKNIIVTGQANDATVITDALKDGYQPFQVAVSVMSADGETVIANTVLDRFGQYDTIRVPSDIEIIKSTHEDEKEAAMADLHANMVLTAGTASEVEHAVKVAFGDELNTELGQFQARLQAVARVFSGVDLNKHEEAENEAEFSIYPAARDFVIENNKCSISAIQRHLRIGYNHAARIVEKLEDEGVVSKPSDNGTRKVIHAKPEGVSEVTQ